MSQEKTLSINVLIDIDPDTLEVIVENEKEAAGLGKKGVRTVDTAGKVGELISRFLAEQDFDRFARDSCNYGCDKQKILF